MLYWRMAFSRRPARRPCGLLPVVVLIVLSLDLRTTGPSCEQALNLVPRLRIAAPCRTRQSSVCQPGNAQFKRRRLIRYAAGDKKAAQSGGDDIDGKTKGGDKYVDFLRIAREEGADSALRFAMERMPKKFCQDLQQFREAAEYAQHGGDKHSRFVHIAREEGAERAMEFAMDCMPEAFCKHFSQLRDAAEFAHSAGPSQDSAAKRWLTQDSMAKDKVELRTVKAAPAEVWQGSAAAPENSSAKAIPKAKLQVCDKCVRRLQKKAGSVFDVASALRQLADHGNMLVQTVPCMKMCKKGPNVRVVLDGHAEGQGDVVRGMTAEETSSRCFHGVTDERSAIRVFKLAKLAVDTPASAVDTAAEKTDVLLSPEPPSAIPDEATIAERTRRAQVRSGIEARVAAIVADLDIPSGQSPTQAVDEEL